MGNAFSMNMNFFPVLLQWPATNIWFSQLRAYTRVFICMLNRKVGVFFCCILPYCVRQGLLSNLELTDSVRLAGRYAPGRSLHFCPLSAGIIGARHHSRLFTLDWGAELTPSCLWGKHFADWGVSWFKLGNTFLSTPQSISLLFIVTVNGILF